MKLVLIGFCLPDTAQIDRVACEGHAAVLREYAEFWPVQYPKGTTIEGTTYGDCPVPLLTEYDKHREG